MGTYISPISTNFLPLSGGTVTGETIFTQDVYSNVVSATTLSASTIYSGNTNLYDIFLTTAEVDGLAQLESVVYANNQLVSGGAIYLSGLTYDITPLNYIIGEEFYSISLATQVTANSGDTTYDRIDLIIADISGNTSVLEGTPSLSPVSPDLNETIQIQVAIITIAANATTIAVTEEMIYNENVEWTTSATTANINFDYTGDFYSGSKSVLFSAVTNGNKATFVSSSNFDTSNVDSFRFAYKLITSQAPFISFKATFYDNANLQNGNSVQINNNASYGWSSPLVGPSGGVWAVVTVPIADFNLTSTSVKYVKIGPIMSSGAFTVKLDTIKFIETSIASSTDLWYTVKADGTELLTPIGQDLLTFSGGTNISTTALTASNTVLIDLEDDISLNSISATTITGTTFYGDGSQLSGIASEFTGGTVTGETIFSGGISATTLNIGVVGSGILINNLGIDVNGNIVSGTTSIGNSLFVSSSGKTIAAGATVGSLMNHFSNINEAISSAVSGDTIYVYGGTYTGVGNLYKNGVNWEFLGFPTLTSNAVLFSDGGVAGTFKVKGNAIIANSAVAQKIFQFTGVGTAIDMEFHSISAGYVNDSLYFSNTTGKLNVAEYISATTNINFIALYLGASVEITAKNIIHNTLNDASSYGSIRLYGGYIGNSIINAESITRNGGALGIIRCGNGDSIGGSLTINSDIEYSTGIESGNHTAVWCQSTTSFTLTINGNITTDGYGIFVYGSTGVEVNHTGDITSTTTNTSFPLVTNSSSSNIVFNLSGNYINNGLCTNVIYVNGTSSLNLNDTKVYNNDVTGVAQTAVKITSDCLLTLTNVSLYCAATSSITLDTNGTTYVDTHQGFNTNVDINSNIIFNDYKNYVPNLNIGLLGTGTSINTLGIDSSGNVVTGATGGGSITGTGTTNSLSKWSSSTDLTDSTIIDDGTDIYVYTIEKLRKKTPYDFGTVITGSTIDWDLSVCGMNTIATLDGTGVTLSITAQTGDYGTIVMKQNAVGGYNLTLPVGSIVSGGGGGFVYLTPNASAVDLLNFYYDGTNYYWSAGYNYN